MLTNIKSWLATSGYPVEALYFKVPPALPYIIFLDTTEVSGADNKNFIADRQISVELYSTKKDSTAEAAIENLLTNIPYTKESTWIETEGFVQTVYDFKLTEKL